MSNNYGTNVSRVMDPTNTNFVNVLWQKRVPVPGADLNLLQDIQRSRLDTMVGNMLPPGVLLRKLNPSAQDWVFGRDLTFTEMDDRGNQLGIPNFRILVNNWLVDVVGSRVGPATLADINYNSIELPAPPSVGQRQDLVFLEVWQALVQPNPSIVNKPAADKIWPYGNVLYKGTTYNDDLIDPALGRAVTRRIQIQYRLRVVTGVNLSTYPEGLQDPAIMAQGAAASASTYGYTRVGNSLYRAGDGTTGAQTELGTVDGFVWAMPICAVHRRNTTAYNVNTNPNGSSVSILDATESDRPDGLFNDEITETDVKDLRHDINPAGWDKSVLLEQAFRDLVNGQLKTGWQGNLTGTGYGATSLLRVEGVSVADQIGINDIDEPDGVRRVWSDAPGVQRHAGSVVQGTAVATGRFQHDDALNTVTVVAPTGTINATPTMTWVADGASNGQAVAITGSWSGSGTGTRTATLNTGDANYTAGGRIAVTFDETFPAGQGLTYNPTTVHKVFNAKVASPEEWGFTLRGQTSRTVPITSTSTVPGEPDTAVDWSVDSPAVTRGYSRLITYHLAGNGTTTYLIPATLYGRSVVGLSKVEVAIGAGAYNIVSPSTVTRGAGGELSITMPTLYTPSDRLRFSVSVAAHDMVVDTTTRALAEMTQTVLFQFTVSDVDTVANVDVGQLVKAVGHLERSPGVLTPYVFRTDNNQLLDLVNVQVYGSVLRLTFTGAATGTFKIPLVMTYAPDASDRLQVYYTHDTYQGAWRANVLDGATIVALGKSSVVHTLGTALEVAGLPALASTRLPLGSAKVDGSLDSQDVQSEFTAPWVEGAPFRNTKEHLGYGFGPRVGLSLLQQTPIGTPVPPKRGAASAELLASDGTLSGVLEVQTPTLGASATYQAVHYALVKTSGGELMMLVGTGVFTGTGADRLAVDQGTAVAFDVFHLPGRPVEG